MSRFINAPQELVDLLGQLKSQHFHELANAQILCLMDTEKSTSGGTIRFAKIQKTNDLLRHLTKDMADDVDGMDYIIVVDQVLWSFINPDDKARILRHELRHTTYDPEAKNPYGLRDHVVQDFYEEIELNADDPRWKLRLAMLLENEYTIRANTARYTQVQTQLFDEAEIEPAQDQTADPLEDEAA